MDQVATGFKLDAIKLEPRDTSPSPYHGNLSPYAGLTPQYVPNLGSSPIYQYQLNVTGNTQLNTSTFGNNSQQAWNTQMTLLPQGNASLPDSNTQPTWNITLPSANVAVAGKSTTNNIGVQESLFYDLDAKQVNSEEIRELISIKDDTQLPEIPADDNLFSFSDLNVQSQDNNMMDSIERLERFTIDNI